MLDIDTEWYAFEITLANRLIEVFPDLAAQAGDPKSSERAIRRLVAESQLEMGGHIDTDIMRKIFHHKLGAP